VGFLLWLEVLVFVTTPIPRITGQNRLCPDPRRHDDTMNEKSERSVLDHYARAL